MKTSEIVVRPRAFIAGAIFVTLVVLLVGAIALFSTGGSIWASSTVAWSNMYMGQFCMSFLWAIVFSALGVLLSRFGMLNKQEMTIVTMMIWIAFLFPSHYGVLGVITMMGTARQIPAFHRWNLDYLKPAHWQWGPDPFNDKLWASWMYGGPVPWAEWMPALLFHIARLIPYYLMFAFFATLWRRQWVDVEALPFPHAIAVAKLIDMAYEKVDGRTRLFQNVWLWLGLLIGFLATYPYWAWTLPGLGLTMPADLGFNVVGINLSPYQIVPLAPLNFTFEAFWIGAALLIPVKTLFSYIIGAIAVHWVWWPMMHYLGYWELGDIGLNVWRNTSTGPLMTAWKIRWGPPAMLAFGAIFALLFYPVFVTFRGELVTGIKALFGKAPPEFEAREPIRYRYLLLCYIALLLISVALWYYASVGTLPILYGIIVYIMHSLLYMGRARVAAEFGCITDLWIYGHGFYHNWNALRVWWIADPGSPLYIRDVRVRYLVLRPDYEFGSAAFMPVAPMGTLLESYKVASAEGVHSRYIFIGMVIAVTLGVVVSLFALLHMWCSFGALNLAAFNYTGVPNNYLQRGPTYACAVEVGDYWRTGLGHHPEPLHWIQFVVGAAMVSIIYALHARFPWFPVNPGGIVIGAFDLVQSVFLLTPAIIAYVAKLVILRIGGTRIYEDVAMPFAIGMAATTGIIVLFSFLYNLSTTLAVM
ncbi:MAG: OPT/YSL family transporter [Candidatus Bathyarchaeota archaeon]|nr:OPT/YSL family transporter [Candidatus Bathyarchaeota archaeon]